MVQWSDGSAARLASTRLLHTDHIPEPGSNTLLDWVGSDKMYFLCRLMWFAGDLVVASAVSGTMGFRLISVRLLFNFGS